MQVCLPCGYGSPWPAVDRTKPLWGKRKRPRIGGVCLSLCDGGSALQAFDLYLALGLRLDGAGGGMGAGGGGEVGDLVIERHFAHRL